MSKSASNPNASSRGDRPRTDGDPASDSISPFAADQMREAIAAASENEVFFIGAVDEGRVSTVEVIARGDSQSVLVFLDRANVGDVILHNHPGGDLTPSRPDFSIAAEAGMRGLGFWIIDNRADRVYRVVEPVGDAPDTSLDPAEIENIFGPEGPLARDMSEYEDRPGQRAMAVEIAEAFSNDRLVACEAGTGVGKSFAYLVPAILWAVRARSRVVISTQTIALSEQLIEKDLPRLRRLLEIPFEFALLKGRGNYACRRKTEETRNDLRSGLALEVDLSDSPTDVDDEAWLRSVAETLESSAEGSLSSLESVPPAAIWDRFQSSSDQSLKVRCPHYAECFFYEARRRAARAQVVVANHHLVMADLAVRRATGNFEAEAVLPPYRRVVFDEAHRLEDVAAQHFGINLSRVGVRQTIGRLISSGRRTERGRFPRAVKKLIEVGRTTTAQRISDELLPVARSVRESIDEPFDHMIDLLAGNGASERPLQEGRTVRLDDPETTEANSEVHASGGAASSFASARAVSGRDEVPYSIELLAQPIALLREEVASLARSTARAATRIEHDPFEPESQFEGLVAEFKSSHQSLVQLCETLDAYSGALGSTIEKNSGGELQLESPDVRWIELQAGKLRNVSLRRAPVRVGPQLADALYDRVDTACFTSATLTVAGSWRYPTERLGWDRVEASRLATVVQPSPFDFDSQAAWIVPTDLPLPDDRDFVPAFGELVLDAVRASKGRAFVLFTSHRMLRSVAARIRPMLTQYGLSVHVQGEAPVRVLLERFRSSGRGVLFGNQAFWEGVDVAGSALSLVVIARLPFRVPNHPLEEGRAEDVKRRGGQPFRDLTLPQSVLALKQGVGRLIRSSRDRGAVVIADRRIAEKSYGRLFLESLPPTTPVRAPWSEGRKALTDFFRSIDKGSTP